ncbi:MAG: hypothetical protein ACE5HS_18770 [bacterium]
MPSTLNVDLMVLVGVILLIFFFCGWIIKRDWIDKKQITSGAQFTGENVLLQYQNEDKKHALEHVIYMRDQEEVNDEEGEDISRLPARNKKKAKG